MSATGRLVGGPCNGQTIIIGQTVEYVDTVTAEEPGDPEQMQMYFYVGQDPHTHEHLFHWSGK